MTIRRLSLLIVAVFVVLAAWLHTQDYMPLMKTLVARTVSQGNYAITADPAEVELLFCGTGSPNRAPFRASPCLALIAYGDLYLFDAGDGAIAKLHEFQAPVLLLRKIFLTHLHSDHMSGVAEVLHNTWLYGRTEPVTLVGPPGTEKLLSGIRESYEDDLEERLFVLGPDGVVAETAFKSVEEHRVEKRSIVTVHEDEKIRIEAFQVDHPHWTYAYGYRIEVAGKTIVVSGDTTISDGIREFAKDADYLIHEAMNSELMSLVGEELEKTNVPVSKSRIARIADVHSDTVELAKLAEEVRARQLVLTHLIPPVPDIFAARRAFTSGMNNYYSGPITTAYDGMILRID